MEKRNKSFWVTLSHWSYLRPSVLIVFDILAVTAMFVTYYLVRSPQAVLSTDL